MFFEKDILSFNILDVIVLNQYKVNSFNSGRNFAALSFRFRSDALLKADKGQYPMADNSVCFVPARLDYTRLSTVDHLIVVHLETMNYSSKAIESFIPKEPEKLAGLFREIADCWSRKEPGYKYKCSALLYEIFGECYRQNYTARSPASKIRNSVSFLNDNFSDPDLTLKAIADKSFMSEVYFRRLFKEEYGISPQKHIIDLRIQQAKGLISTGYYSLSEIAELSGYRDYKYFTSQFKRIVGISPSAYRYNF